MAFTTNTFNFKNKVLPNPNKKTENPQDSFVVELTNFIYKSEESGFYVANVKIPSEYPNLNTKVGNVPIVGRTFKVVGTSLYVVENIKEKQEITVYGNFEIDKDRVQFKADNVVEIIPTKPKAIQVFLSSGKIKGIGPAIAKKIVDRHGSETIKIFDENPRVLLEIDGITEKKLSIINESWKFFRNVYEIISTMQLYNVGDANGVKIYNHFKEKSLNIMKQDPYRLTEVPMIGFKTADKIAQSIGISHIDPQRIKYCILYTLEKLSDDGHTAYIYEDLISKVNDDLVIEPELIEKELKKLIEAKQVITKVLRTKKVDPKNRNNILIGDYNCVAHIKFHNMELKIAREIHRITTAASVKNDNEISSFIHKNVFKLDQSQLDATRLILNSKFSVLTGGPGTGKTHTIKSILHYFKLQNKKCLLCAPTGRAAKRMEESTNHAASTMHRTLGFSDGKFTHDESNKLDADVIFLDESSMTDTYLANGFLKAIKDNAIVIMVGDVDQLPSVGPGNVLKDMIDSGYVTVARLSIIHRQALNSNIIQASHQVIKNELPSCINNPDPDSDFIFIEQPDTGVSQEDNESIFNNVLQLVDELVSSGKYKKDDIQVITPRKDTLCGVEEMNKGLKQLLNYDENFEANAVEHKIKFGCGDRVMQYKNNYELDIFNGDVGKVIDLNFDDLSSVIEFDNRYVDIDGSNLNDLKLSYAITIHKSQGSDYPCVIIPISKSHSFMWDSNLLYTAITRGKNQVYLIGDKKTLFYTVAKFKQNWRVTGLKQEIQNVFSPELEIKEVIKMKM